MISGLLTKIFGSRNDRLLKQYQRNVERINALEPQVSPLSDEALRAKTTEFRERIAKGETVDQLLPEAFAVVREASKRTLGQRHFDVQLIGGMVLHDGKIAEMRTGEGKTLTATLAVYLNALVGKGVHVVTVNDYLVTRDADWMGRVYRFLGHDRGHGRQPAVDRGQARRLRRRHHLRNEQRVRVRLPARQHGVRGGGPPAARARLRDRRRGRLDPDRRSAHAADHLGAGRGPHRHLRAHERGAEAADAAEGREGRRRLLGRREGAPGAHLRGRPREARRHPDAGWDCWRKARACTRPATSS